MIRELALFAGAGGGLLASRLLGWRTVCAVERDAYAVAVLAQRQNDGCLEPFPIWSDVETFDGRPWRDRVDIVSGGFPCQDISCAGKGAGIDGERSGLWGEMARVIREVRPRYCFVENSPMLTSRGLHRVLGDLAEMGFDARWGVLGADDAGAPHRRKRIWIVGDSGSETCRRDAGRVFEAEASFGGTREQHGHQPDGSGDAGAACGEGNVAHSHGRRLPWEWIEEHGNEQGTPGTLSDGCCQGGRGGWSNDSDTRCSRRQADEVSQAKEPCSDRLGEDAYTDPGRERLETKLAAGAATPSTDRPRGRDRAGWWCAEPDVGRMADGVASQVDRLRCIGNGQVPAVAALAWEVLSR